MGAPDLASPSKNHPSGCDAAEAFPANRKIDDDLELMRRDWATFARYRITLTKEGDWNDKTVIAEWLPEKDAVRISNALDDKLLAKLGNKLHWARAAYGYSLHTPEISRGDKASVGDLLLHECVDPHGEFSLAETVVVRQFFVVAIVLAVSGDGRITMFRDKAGVHYRAPRNPYVVSASEVDVQGVLNHVRVTELARGHWAGEFDRPRTLEPVLVRYQRLKATVFPA